MSWPACFATASGPTGFGPMLFPGRVREAEACVAQKVFQLAPAELRRRAHADLDAFEAELARHKSRLAHATASGPTGFGPMLFPGRVREAALVSRELGFEGIEISMRSPAELRRRELEDLLRDAGLRLAALSSGRAFLEDGLSL